RERVETLAANVLRDDEGTTLVLAEPIHLDDVGVLQAGRGARFDREPLARLVVEMGDDFDGDQAIEQAIVREPDATHAAMAERADQFVLVELRARRLVL